MRSRSQLRTNPVTAVQGEDQITEGAKSLRRSVRSSLKLHPVAAPWSTDSNISARAVAFRLLDHSEPSLSRRRLAQRSRVSEQLRLIGGSH